MKGLATLSDLPSHPSPLIGVFGYLISIMNNTGDYKMGREVRMVPEKWEHPKQDNGNYTALLGSTFKLDAAEWDEECNKWNSGDFPDYACEESRKLSYLEWNGERPDASEYMPSFPDGEATHCMMYETTSEGTPISPSFQTPEELAKWLYEAKASAFGSQTASYESWLRVAKGGFACSAVVVDGTITSGVEYSA